MEALSVFPYEQQIDAEIRLLQRIAADQAPAPSAPDSEVGPVTLPTSSRTVREQQVLDGELQKRVEVSRVLNGDKLGTHEVEWSGTDPAAPVSDGIFGTTLRPEVLKTWLMSFGFTAVLLLAETYVMMRNVKMFIRGEPSCSR